MSTIVTFTPQMESLGAAAVAIGVFDGVHRGHQALLAATVRSARREGVASIALTFDRDPDQVVTPDDVAPQLLSLDDKCTFIAGCGIDHVVVVPFTTQLAALSAEEFLDGVLRTACEPTHIHVGRDFRFGARAAGDTDTLFVWGVEHGADVVAHDLVALEGGPVTSTRIRALIAEGDLDAARHLLTRPHRVSGTVVRARQLGRELGFPTANLEPAPFSAMPPDGVYAGFTLLDDGSAWPSALTVGPPPSFPEATSVVESHLIGFEGDIYGQRITIEFVAHLRDQRRFDSMDALTAAITSDVEAASRVLGEEARGQSAGDDEFVSDPTALAMAEAAVAAREPGDAYTEAAGAWLPVVSNVRISGMLENAAHGSFAYTSALDAADIPYMWDPYPPDQMPGFRPFYGAFDRPFTLMVPEERLAEAQRALARTEEPPVGVVPEPDEIPEADAVSMISAGRSRTVTIWLLILVFFGLDLLVLAVGWLLDLY